ncbi:MAG: FtsL-like putative cell division protein [Bacteroidota bacterium]
MSENTLKDQEPPTDETVEVAPKKKKRKLPSWLRLVNVFEWFDRDQIVSNMPFILYVTLLMLCYIGNTYYAERLIRDTDKIRSELKDCSAEFVSTRSQMMFEMQQSELAKSAAPIGLSESKEPPSKIVIEKSANSEKD